MTDTHTAGEQFRKRCWRRFATARLKTVRNSQSAGAAAIQALALTVQSITLALLDANVPFAERLPKPQELIASAYDFAEDVLKAPRRCSPARMTPRPARTAQRRS